MEARVRLTRGHARFYIHRQMVRSPRAGKVWFVKLDAPTDSPPLQALLSGGNKIFTLNHALSQLRKKLYPELLVLLAPPALPLQEIFQRIRRSAPRLPIATLAFWHDEQELKEWFNAEILNTFRPKRLAPKANQNSYRLSKREYQILRLMVRGLIKKEIATQLSLSYHTVDNHHRRIFQKLNVHTRSAAVAKAIMEKLC